MATATKTQKKALYTSTSHDLVVLRLPPDELVMPNGKTHVRNMSAYEKAQLKFQNGFLELREGQDVLPTGPEGEDEDAVTFLERQPSFGSLFQRIDDPAPPVSVEEMTTIATLAAQGDRQALAAIYEAETEGHGRPEVLQAIEAANEATLDREGK